MTHYGKVREIEKVSNDVSELLHDGKLFIFTKTECPFCDLAKDYLDEKHVPFEYIYGDKLGITDEQKEQLGKMTGEKTYPRIFIGKKSVGGFSQLRELDENGTIDKWLDEEHIPHLKFLQYGVPTSKL